ncbi:MAG: xanthine phosphoribosyltransferase [Eubacteriales bacterium]|nr:xanthine phosphoribosyltransferase [Eubacteriales bacterium]
MKALEEAIQQWGEGIGTSIVKVDRFLNHRIDTGLLTRMGREIADYFRADAPTVILTVEASGIALAITTAQALDNIPVVFAKKHAASTLRGEMYAETIRSFTKDITYDMRCASYCVTASDRVLIVDDFLADGEATRGMLSLVSQAGARCVGVAIAIEKAFQKGGRTLRDKGIKVLSLAAVREIRDGKILFQEG